MRLRAGAYDMVMNGTEINEINVGQAVGSLHNLRSMMFDIIMNIIQSIIYIIPRSNFPNWCLCIFDWKQI